MPADIREYLLDRFQSDAATLRQRAETLRGASRPSPGPNAALSTSMAEACERVVALAEELPENAPVDVIIDALKLLVPKLMQLANSPEASASPPIRSVYVGACTRAQELIAAESSAASLNVAHDPLSDSDGAAGLDEDFADDDDLYDDDLREDHRT